MRSSLYFISTMFSYALSLLLRAASGQDNHEPIRKVKKMAQKAEFTFQGTSLLTPHSTAHHPTIKSLPLWGRTLDLHYMDTCKLNVYSFHQLVLIVQPIYFSICKTFWSIWGWIRAQHNFPSEMNVGSFSWNSSSLSGQAFRNKSES